MDNYEYIAGQLRVYCWTIDGLTLFAELNNDSVVLKYLKVYSCIKKFKQHTYWPVFEKLISINYKKIPLTKQVQSTQSESSRMAWSIQSK